MEMQRLLFDYHHLGTLQITTNSLMALGTVLIYKILPFLTKVTARLAAGAYRTRVVVWSVRSPATSPAPPRLVVSPVPPTCRH